MQPLAKKSLGQHFLKTPAISQQIVDFLDLKSHDKVLEIGPGQGALTYLLAKHEPREFIILEKDQHWAAEHAQHFSNNESVKVISCDAMQFYWEGLAGQWKIISNLPYNIGSPLIWDIVSRVSQLQRAVFMVQKEVAERLAAPSGTRNYGMLSVWVQSFMQVEWGFVVGPEHFAPPPKVDSAVLLMRPLAVPLAKNEYKNLELLLKICFQQRRKQLQSILRKHGIHSAQSILEEVGINPAARPETLACDKFQALATKCAPFLLTSCPKHD